MCLKDWANELGVEYHKLYNRIMRDGYSFEDAIDKNFGKLKRNNTSGVSGISYHKGKKAWQVYTWKDGKQLYIGQTKTLEEAIQLKEKYCAEQGE